MVVDISVSHYAPESSAASITAPLMEEDIIVAGSVDFKGHPVLLSRYGGWRSACFIVAVEMAERFAYFGISSNLITYLTGPLAQSTATAAENVNTWSGTATLLPLLGAFLADSFLGRYRTIIVASLLYILGLGLLTVSAMLTSHHVSECRNTDSVLSCSPSLFQVILTFVSLYLVAVGQGAHKPCVLAFGGDQFDGRHQKESMSKSSYFNWVYFGSSVSINLTLLVSVYIQDNLNWVLGFGILCIMMLASLLVFLLGSRTYRYSVKGTENNPFTRIGIVILRAIKNWRTAPAGIVSEDSANQYHQISKQYKFLNKSLLTSDGTMEDPEVCSITDVEETKSLLRLIPIWVTSLAYGIVFAQTQTFFTKQGATMDRTISGGFKIPAASLQFFVGAAIILVVPIYDRIFVPLARNLTKSPSGITMLQRIGAGMVLSALSMVIAALVEMKRLQTAKEYGLIDLPNATIPMSIWWLVPQYLFCGAADVFTIVGLQEFFYDQVPKELRSLGMALYLSVLGIGSFLSSFLVSVIDKATGGDGHDSWLTNNLNRGHLDYFYWLLAGLGAAGFTGYLYFARSYNYRRESVS